MGRTNKTTTIHGNHGFFTINGEIIGRARNCSMTLEGNLDEFYEVGSAWIQDKVVINRKVAVNVERGIIDFRLLAIAAGVVADITGDAASFYKADDPSKFDLLIDEDTGETIFTVSPAGNDNQRLTTAIEFDFTITANKIVSDAGTILTEIFVTALDCTIFRAGITAPTQSFWTSSIDMVGKRLAIGGIVGGYKVN